MKSPNFWDNATVEKIDENCLGRILCTYVEIRLFRSAPKNVKLLHVKYIMTLMWNFLRQILRCGKKDMGLWSLHAMRLGPKSSPATKATQSSSETQRIHQKSKFSSFSDRKKPLDPSHKNNEGPLPANLGSFGKISPNLHFSTFRCPLGTLRSFRD